MCETLKVKMFGGLSIEYMGKKITLDRSLTSKTTQLFEIILLCGEKGISKSRLIELVYGREDVENRNASLNNTVFRLRKQLKMIGLPESKYINIGPKGLCKWDYSIPVEIDCWKFAEEVERGREETDAARKAEAYFNACSLYTGELLPDMIGEDWAAVHNLHYQNMYCKCLKELCEYLQKEKRYKEIYQLTTVAAGIHPFQDWQIWRIDSLLAMNKNQEAMDVYEETVRMFFDELGESPSEEMLDRFHRIATRLYHTQEGIDKIVCELNEKGAKEGAYYCNYPSFLDMYHVMVRLTERTKRNSCMMLCTLKNKDGQIYDDQENGEMVGIVFKQMVKQNLRKGDFYTKYNSGQYLIVLPGIDEKNCNKITERIRGMFFKAGGVKMGFNIECFVSTL